MLLWHVAALDWSFYHKHRCYSYKDCHYGSVSQDHGFYEQVSTSVFWFNDSRRYWLAAPSVCQASFMWRVFLWLYYTCSSYEQLLPPCYGLHLRPFNCPLLNLSVLIRVAAVRDGRESNNISIQSSLQNLSRTKSNSTMMVAMLSRAVSKVSVEGLTQPVGSVMG